ncbi:guanine nucleotide binding protein, alpha subunit, partial [Mycena galopus ATCC 62051]
MRRRSLTCSWSRRWLLSSLDPTESRSEKIDVAIAQERRQRGQVTSVLVLGGRDSGKSTFLKQATVFGAGFSQVERDEYKAAIHLSVIRTARVGFEALLAVDSDLQDRELIQSFCQATEESQDLSSQVSAALCSLWVDPKVQAALRCWAKLQPDNSFLYFMDSLFRLTASGYSPTDADIMRLKSPSPAVTDTPFEFRVTYSTSFVNLVKMILSCVHCDVGMQRKWSSFFRDVEAIIFLVDLSSYDDSIYSSETDEPRNQMKATMQKFQSACTASPNSTIVLIMNKMDIFTLKLLTSPLTLCFPEYQGENTPNAAAAYCITQFMSLLPDQPYGARQAWCTSAIDVDQMQGILREIGEFIEAHNIRPICCLPG